MLLRPGAVLYHRCMVEKSETGGAYTVEDGGVA